MQGILYREVLVRAGAVDQRHRRGVGLVVKEMQREDQFGKERSDGFGIDLRLAAQGRLHNQALRLRQAKIIGDIPKTENAPGTRAPRVSRHSALANCRLTAWEYRG